MWFDLILSSGNLLDFHTDMRSVFNLLIKYDPFISIRVIYKSKNINFINIFSTFYLSMKYIIRKSIIIRCGKIFRLNIWYFCIIICFLTRLLRSGILLSTALGAAVVVNPSTLGISSLIFNLSFLSTLLFKLFKPLGTFSNLSMFSLSISEFKLVKWATLANFDVSTPVAVLSQIFLHNFSFCFYYGNMVLENSFFYIYIISFFLLIQLLKEFF